MLLREYGPHSSKGLNLLRDAWPLQTRVLLSCYAPRVCHSCNFFPFPLPFSPQPGVSHGRGGGGVRGPAGDAHLVLPAPLQDGRLLQEPALQPRGHQQHLSGKMKPLAIRFLSILPCVIVPPCEEFWKRVGSRFAQILPILPPLSGIVT